MSMSVRCDGCGLEYAGARGIGGPVPHRKRLPEPQYLRMLAEVLRFHRAGPRVLADPNDDGSQTLREFLAEGNFSPYFVGHFMTPVVSAVWSCAPDIAGEYPARYLFAFLANHGMLVGHRLADLAHRGRRLAAATSKLAAKSLTAVLTSTPVETDPRTATGSRSARSTARPTSSTPWSSPPTRTRRWRCSPTPIRSRAARCSARSTTRATRRCCTPTPRCCRAPSAPRPPGTTSCRLCSDGRQVHVTYDMNRLQRLDTRHPLPGHAQRRRPRSTLTR